MKSDIKKLLFLVVLGAFTLSGCTKSSGYEKLDEWTQIGWPCWRNEFSNTVFFKRPSPEIYSKYNLALGYDDQFGGELAHVVVMQHVTKAKIDGFIKALEQEMP